MVKKIVWLAISSAIALVTFSLYFLPSSLLTDPSPDFQQEVLETTCEEGWIKTDLPTGTLCTKEEPTQRVIDEFSGNVLPAGEKNTTIQVPDNQTNVTKQSTDNQFPILDKIRNGDYSKDGWDEEKRLAFVEELKQSDFWKSNQEYLKSFEEDTVQWKTNHINEVFTCDNYQELAYEYRTDYYLETMVYEKYIKECNNEKDD